jgi:hypothetical protein
MHFNERNEVMEMILQNPGLMIVLVSWIICGITTISTKDSSVLLIPTFISLIFIVSKCLTEAHK